MSALNETQLRAIVDAAAQLPDEKRDVFLTRVLGMLEHDGPNFTEAEFAAIIERALLGLRHPA